MRRFTVLIADAYPVVLEGLRKLLNEARLQVVGAAADGEALIEQTLRLKPNVVVIGIETPGLDQLELLHRIRQRRPYQKIVFMTGEREQSHGAVSGPGLASISKQTAGDELIPAIREVLAGRSYVSHPLQPRIPAVRNSSVATPSRPSRLTSRQQQVVRMLARGHSVKDVAHSLSLSPRTIEFHKYKVMEMLGARSLAELCRYAVSYGLA